MGYLGAALLTSYMRPLISPKQVSSGADKELSRCESNAVLNALARAEKKVRSKSAFQQRRADPDIREPTSAELQVRFLLVGCVVLLETAMARYGKKAGQKVKRAMHERNSGKLRSGRSGKKVKSRKQAIAIGLSEARKAGAKVPRKRATASGPGKKTGASTTPAS